MLINLWRRPSQFPLLKKQTIVAIGNFDGLHLGHQKILETTQELAGQTDCDPVLLTFDPYPQQFFHPEKPVPRLTTLREKVDILRVSPLQIIYALPFNRELSLYSPEKFIQEILLQQLNAKIVVVGDDFRFGFQRKGDVKFLKRFLEVKVVSPVTYQEMRISSTRVREALQMGHLALIKALVGRDYSLIGRVIRGHQRGRQWGFPTANISLEKRITPLKGVFAVRVNHQYAGVANLGSRPTVDGSRIFLEVYLFNFDQDIYGEYLHVEFIHKIRDEKRFDSLEALKEQIAQDVMSAKIKLG